MCHLYMCLYVCLCGQTHHIVVVLSRHLFIIQSSYSIPFQARILNKDHSVFRITVVIIIIYQLLLLPLLLISFLSIHFMTIAPMYALCFVISFYCLFGTLFFCVLNVISIFRFLWFDFFSSSSSSLFPSAPLFFLDLRKKLALKNESVENLSNA